MKKVFLIFILFLLTTSVTSAYDKIMAESYAQYFKPFSEKSVGKSLHMIGTATFVEYVKAEELFVIDIRTSGEAKIYGFTIPGSIAIPMDKIFKPENLVRLPTDKKIVIVCKAGHRAMAVSTALRHIGFDNVYLLKLGLQDLAKYLSPNNAY
ncbi:MAG: rhodanese-like domain-containing protein [gamma proteobacterium symbiont of Taylorina sp.]|nr:rhodanese-like domain-containing protein [gamma proteobacterium symbiont of Taylorina sp.]